MFCAQDMEDFLITLYKNKQNLNLKSLLLCCFSGHFGPLQYLCTDKRRVCVNKVTRLWPAKKQDIQIQNTEDVTYLSQTLGRPVFKLLSLPLHTRLFGARKPSVLYVEFLKTRPESLKKFFTTLRSVITRNVDRILMEEHLRTSSELWTCTFNELKEPLMVQDRDGQVCNHNQAFQDLFATKKEAFKDQALNLVSHKDRIYEKHTYPARLKDGNYTISHYSDRTRSFLLRNQMIQKAREEAVEDLGEKVAHQLSNPLTGILSLTQVLLPQKHLNATVKKHLQDMAQATQRCQKIISNLLDFARLSHQLQICDLNRIVKNTLPFLNFLNRGGLIHFKQSPSPVWIKAQPCLLGQVVFNLLKNACQATTHLKPKQARVQVEVVFQKNTALLTVQDSGRGVAKTDCENLFKPFFTTKENQTGTGLGLNVSSRIIKNFKGDISYEKSKKWGGACFKVLLPLHSL